MWLLNTTTHRLSQFFDSDIPAYAILSHTWAKEEISFQDIESLDPLVVARKEGWRKLRDSADMAMRQGYNYIWIDTCCIDKKSSAELSEAINSMFQYYRNAQVCYAFLADVSKWEEPLSDAVRKPGGDWMELFGRSRWFTRGWTLQELIAPQKLEFYDRSWKALGTRDEFVPDLERITGIDAAALTVSAGIRNLPLPDFNVAQRLSTFSIAQRMSWASRRNTSRLEDEAYCLLGIFSVHMPLLYGEGRAAFFRLQEEIMKKSDDHSLFAWTSHAKSDLSWEGSLLTLLKTGQSRSLYPWFTGPEPPLSVHWRNLFARSASEFKDASWIQKASTLDTEPYTMTNQGLSITFPYIEEEPGRIIAILNCEKLVGTNPFPKQLGIYLDRMTTSWAKDKRVVYFRSRTTEVCEVASNMKPEQKKQFLIPQDPLATVWDMSTLLYL